VDGLDKGDEGKNDVWVGCFLKSCRDGQPRDATPIDIIAVLDISGSMCGTVSATGSESRLKLAQDALAQLSRQLRPGDRLGLATFNTTGRVVQHLEKTGDLSLTAFEESVRAITAGGGTTVQAGLEAAASICKEAPPLQGHRHKRVLFLTDMHDVNSQNLNHLISEQAKDGVYVSFVCIGMEFNSRLAAEVTKHQGANYFCITQDTELQKVIVDDFDWNFFPVAFDVEVVAQSDSFDLVGVYGTPYETRVVEETDWMPSKHRLYPKAAKREMEDLLLCYRGHLPSPALKTVFDFMSSSARSIIRVDTVFPSGLADDGAVEGGLILLRLRPKEPQFDSGTVQLMLRYLDSLHDDAEMSHCVELSVPTAHGDVVTEPAAVRKGVMLQRFVEVTKGYLQAVHASRGGSSKEDLLTMMESLDGALKRVQALLAHFEAYDEAAMTTEEVGVKTELETFAKMAKDHYSMIAERAATAM